LLVDGLVNLVPSSVNPVDHVVNLVSSSVEPLTQMIDLFPPIDPIFHLENETQVVVTSSVNPTPPLMSANVVDLVPPSIDPTPP
jgi:hypothetical protein